MSRFFVPKESVKGNKIYITGLEAHHILDVMRLKASDEVVVFDGTGKEYTGIVTTADRRSLEVEIKSTRQVSSGRDLLVTLVQAIPKKAKMDYIVEKATELGVSRVIPVTTERTIPEWDDSKRTSIVDRWRKIAREAAKQCGRPDVPEITSIITIGEAVSVTKECGLKLIAVLSDKAIKLKDALKDVSAANIAVAIGPEGDFTPGEAEDALRAGFRIVSLGPLVLRSDTAGLAVLSMINYEYAN